MQEDDSYEMFKIFSKKTEYLRKPEIIEKKLYHRKKAIERYYKKIQQTKTNHRKFLRIN